MVQPLSYTHIRRDELKGERGCPKSIFVCSSKLRGSLNAEYVKSKSMPATVNRENAWQNQTNPKISTKDGRILFSKTTEYLCKNMDF